jgi:hypothetical protein
MTRKTFVLVAAMLCVAPAFAAYLPKGAAAAAGGRNMVLIYNAGDGHRLWKQADFVPLLSHSTLSSKPLAPMFDSLLVLPLMATSGRGFVSGFGSGPSNVTDWTWYADSRLFGGDDQLRSLDHAATQVKTALNAPGLRWKVFLTIPYPDASQLSFGAIDSTGRSLNFANPNDRVLAAQWYISKISAQWKAAGYQSIDFVGWYWLQELVPSGDQSTVQRVAAAVHADGRKFLWIPYYAATGYAKWSTWGFDAAIYQPNYFFTATLPYSRLTDAATAASRYGMGVELELDDRAISSSDFRLRYENYLRAGRAEGFQTGAVTAWYMGGDTLLKCALSTDPATRGIYDETWDFIAQDPIPGDADTNRIINSNDAGTILAAAAGLRQSVGTGISLTAADVVRDGHLDILDAVRTLRYVAGLDTALP